MNKKLILIVSAIGAALVIYGLIFLLFPGEVTVAVDSSSFSQVASLTTDQDHFKVSHPLPATLKLRSGRHRLLITPESKLAEIVEKNIRVWPLTKKSVPVFIGTGDLPGARGAAENPYLKFFPHRTGDYLLEAELSLDFTTIQTIRLTVLHRFTSPSDGAAYTSEHDLAVASAKKYLAESGIPDTIALNILDD